MGILSRKESAVLEPVFATGAIEPAGKGFEPKATEAAAHAEVAIEMEPFNFIEAANDDDDFSDDYEVRAPLIDAPRAAAFIRPTGETF